MDVWGTLKEGGGEGEGERSGVVDALVKSIVFSWGISYCLCGQAVVRHYSHPPTCVSFLMQTFSGELFLCVRSMFASFVVCFTPILETNSSDTSKKRLQIYSIQVETSPTKHLSPLVFAVHIQGILPPSQLISLVQNQNHLHCPAPTSVTCFFQRVVIHIWGVKASWQESRRGGKGRGRGHTWKLGRLLQSNKKHVSVRVRTEGAGCFVDAIYKLSQGQYETPSLRLLNVPRTTISVFYPSFSKISRPTSSEVTIQHF